MPTPTRFVVETRRTILEALAEGHSRETAARLAGINPATLSKWVKRGSEATRGSRYREFAEQVAMAEAAARGRALSILNRAMVDQPKWAAWFLERRDPAFAPPASRQDTRPQAVAAISLQFDSGYTEPTLVTNEVEALPNEAS